MKSYMKEVRKKKGLLSDVKKTEMVWTLDENVGKRPQARQTLDIYTLRCTKRPRGRRRLTWLEITRRDLQNFGITEEQSHGLVEDGFRWQQLVCSV